MIMKLAPDWTVDEMRAVKRRRKALGLTQAQFASRLGLEQSMISRIELGRAPSTVVAAALRFYLSHYQAEHEANGKKGKASVQHHRP